jgi:hypothetical protein
VIRMGSLMVLPRPAIRSGMKSDMRVIGFSALSPRPSRRLRRMERTTPVLTETGVLAFVLGWDIVENLMGKVIKGFVRYEVEINFMKGTASPEVWLQGRSE